MYANVRADRHAPRRATNVRRRRETLILDSLEELLEETRLKELSVEQIAEHAGISRPRFYNYYESKDDAYAALLQRVASEIIGLYDHPHSWFQGSATVRPREALYATITQVGYVWLEHRAVMREGADLWNTAPEARDLWNSTVNELITRMTRAIERERARGMAPAGPPADQLAHGLIWCGERMLFLKAIDAPDAPSLDELAEATISIYMRSIYLADDPAPS